MINIKDFLEARKKPSIPYTEKYRDIVCGLENICTDDINVFLSDAKVRLGEVVYKEWLDGSISAANGDENTKYDVFITRMLNEIYMPFNGIMTHYELKDLPPDTRYFYVINLATSGYFYRNRDIGFKNVPLQVISDVRNNKAKILFTLPAEGDCGSRHAPEAYFQLQKWIDEAILPPKNICFINGNYLSEDLPKKDYRIQYDIRAVQIFESWNDIVYYEWDKKEKGNTDQVIEFKPVDNQYLYLNLNRTARFHRVWFLSEIMRAGLYEKGLNSFNFEHFLFQGSDERTIETLGNIMAEYDSGLLPEAIELYKKGKVILDVETVINAVALRLSPELHERTFVSVVTETLIDFTCLFISEKTFKPIIVGQPFIILGSNGILAKLKELGYKTFDRWFDESYDNAASYKDKIHIIINNLKKYEKYSIEELKSIKNEMKEVCIHNQNIIRERTERLYYSSNNNHFQGNCMTANRPTLDVAHDVYYNW